MVTDGPQAATAVDAPAGAYLPLAAAVSTCSGLARASRCSSCTRPAGRGAGSSSTGGWRAESTWSRPITPGFGGSDEFAEVEAMDDLVYHYLDVLDRIGLDRPHVVGASFGGWIAAELAVAAPHRVGALVLLAPAGLRLPGHPVADLFLISPEDERRRRRIKRHSHARGCCEGPRPVAAGPEMAALGRFYRDAAAASPVALPSSPVIANASLPLS